MRPQNPDNYIYDEYVETREGAIASEEKRETQPFGQSAFRWRAVREPPHEDPLSLLRTAVLVVISGCDFEFKTQEKILGFCLKNEQSYKSMKNLTDFATQQSEKIDWEEKSLRKSR